MNSAEKLEMLTTKYCVSKLTLSKLKRKNVIVRIDANVPIKNGKIVDDSRLRKSLPTLKFLLKQKVNRITLISHLGRPKGVDKAYSLHIVAKALTKLLKRSVCFHHSHSFADYSQLPKKEQAKRIVLLENIRFDAREGKNSLAFAKELAKFGTIYVNDAFGTAHRKHTSNNAITKLLPSYTGLLIKEEITQLSSVVLNPQTPFVVLVGFAKIVDKIPILTKLIQKADHILIGGAVAQTFLLAKGLTVGKSLVEPQQVPLAKTLLKKYSDKIILPVDVTCAKTLSAKSQEIVSVDEISSSLAVFDIGPKTTQLFSTHLKSAKQVFWNGPVGVFEMKPYDKQTNTLAKVLSKSSAKSIIGGGDTANAIEKSGFGADMSHISTGGGASLAFLKNPLLPAFGAIIRSHK